MDPREQACWLLLVYGSGLPVRVANDILVIWCKQLNRTLQDFFAVDEQVWSATCHLKADVMQKLRQAKEKLVGQAFLVEQLQHDHIRLITVLDAEYPLLLKKGITRSQIPSILFSLGDLQILQRQTVAIIGSRNASEASLTFTRSVACYLAQQGANIISGNARGVDRTAYEGAIEGNGYTTVVLPHGIRKLSKVQMRALLPHIEAGKVLLLSQFHPDAPWLVSRAMDRNMVVTGLAQTVIVAESDSKGGTWEGANGALKQGKRVYARDANEKEALPGNRLLLEKGAKSLKEPVENITDMLSPLLQEGQTLHVRQSSMTEPPS